MTKVVYVSIRFVNNQTEIFKPSPITNIEKCKTFACYQHFHLLHSEATIQVLGRALTKSMARRWQARLKA